MLYLVTGTNNQGYDIAINNAFSAFRSIFKKVTRSAFTQARKRISYVFILAQFEILRTQYQKKRATHKGLYIYSCDGDQYDLPRTNDLEKNGFKGYPLQDNMETHCLKMYTVTAIDPISGIPMMFDYSTSNDEIGLVIPMISKFESNSLAIFDRLYISSRLLEAFHNTEKYFICRVKSSYTFAEITSFANSEDRERKVTINKVVMRLIKETNPKTGKDTIVATNLIDKEKFSNKEIVKLYFKRWESEIVNKDATQTQKLEQFHSKSLNGILQEIYMTLWIMMFAKMQIAKEVQPEKYIDSDDYCKANFKETLDFIVENIPRFFVKSIKVAYKELKHIIIKSIEKRIHFSRSYERKVKSRKANSYKNASVVPRKTIFT